MIAMFQAKFRTKNNKVTFLFPVFIAFSCIDPERENVA
jgi:hypothetical protein